MKIYLKLIKCLIVCLALVIPAKATVWQIYSELYITEGQNLWWWSYPDLEPPVYAYVVCEYDDTVENEGDEYRGIYESPEAVIQLNFYAPSYGEYTVILHGTEVEIWNGELGAKGITFGNAFEGWDEGNTGLWFGEYTGIYFAALTYLSDPLVEVDGVGLENVQSLEIQEDLFTESYAFLSGHEKEDPWDYNIFLRTRNTHPTYYSGY